jgi:hypothetical protein
MNDRAIPHAVAAALVPLGASLLLMVGCDIQPAQQAAEGASTGVPEWVIDPTWPPTLPNDWILGDIRGMFIDDDDHLWVIHMPSSLTSQEIGAAEDPPIADCCFPAPPVLELEPEGNILQAWGGESDEYTWFDQEHGIYIDHNDFVWLGTSNGTHVMKFTRDGQHVLTIGGPGVNMGSNDPSHLGGPANFFVEPSTNELFIADGYRNRRVVVFDAATGEYIRHWGAYGNVPDDDYRYRYPVRPEDPPQQYSTVHGIVGSDDGLIHVADRRGTESRRSARAARTSWSASSYRIPGAREPGSAWASRATPTRAYSTSSTARISASGC